MMDKVLVIFGVVAIVMVLGYMASAVVYNKRTGKGEYGML